MVIEKVKNQNGITLVALIVTVILLVILTGVTVNTLVGDNGILTASKESKNAYESQLLNKQYEMNDTRSRVDQMNPDQADLNNIGKNPVINTTTNTTGNNEVTPPLVDPDWDLSIVTPIEDGKGGYIPLPDGYDYKEGDIDTGIVIQGPDGSQFVWVPVDDGVLDRRGASVQAGTLAQYTDYYPTDLKNSIKIYKGFYMGRYESAYDTLISNRKKVAMIPSLVANSYTPSTRGDLMHSLTWAEARSICEVFASQTNTNTSVVSGLPTGGMWDETCMYIEKIPDPKNTDVDCIEWGNYSNDTFSGTTGVGKSGQWEQTKAKNMYDIASNLHEFTSERWTPESYDYYESVGSRGTQRGGRYDTMSYYAPATFRSQIVNDYKSYNTGFRVALYIKTN